MKVTAAALCLALAAPAAAFVQRTQLSGWTHTKAKAATTATLNARA